MKPKTLIFDQLKRIGQSLFDLIQFVLILAVFLVIGNLLSLNIKVVSGLYGLVGAACHYLDKKYRSKSDPFYNGVKRFLNVRFKSLINSKQAIKNFIVALGKSRKESNLSITMSKPFILTETKLNSMKISQINNLSNLQKLGWLYMLIGMIIQFI